MDRNTAPQTNELIKVLSRHDGPDKSKGLAQTAQERESALKLGRSYDPTQPKQPNFPASQTNLALPKAWYERALALGAQAAVHIPQPRAR